jgi:hypothetical protein
MTPLDLDAVEARYDAALYAEGEDGLLFSLSDVPLLLAEARQLEADLTVAVHEATTARAKLAGHGRTGQDVSGGPD